jgi:hypothetical protein
MAITHTWPATVATWHRCRSWSTGRTDCPAGHCDGQDARRRGRRVALNLSLRLLDDGLDLVVSVYSNHREERACILNKGDQRFCSGDGPGLAHVHRLDDRSPLAKYRTGLSCRGSREHDFREVQLVGALDRLGQWTFTGQAHRLREPVLGGVQELRRGLDETVAAAREVGVGELVLEVVAQDLVRVRARRLGSSCHVGAPSGLWTNSALLI